MNARLNATDPPVAGALFRITETVMESVLAVIKPLTEIVAAVVVSFRAPEVTDAEPAVTVTGFKLTTACAGTTDSNPSPNAAIAVDATRLKNVFFDITFLSFVVDKTFLTTADRD